MTKLKGIATKVTVCGLAAAVLSACAGRAAKPVTAIQPQDDLLTCQQIITALKLNTVEIKGLIEQSNKNRGKTAAAGVIGTVVFFPALFFMDVKNAANKEAQALVRRNEVLHERYKLMQCKPEIEKKNTKDIILVWGQKANSTSNKTK